MVRSTAPASSPPEISTSDGQRQVECPQVREAVKVHDVNGSLKAVAPVQIRSGLLMK
jgi:hypothetical protein